jgi:hypothetical protein
MSTTESPSRPVVLPGDRVINDSPKNGIARGPEAVVLDRAEMIAKGYDLPDGHFVVEYGTGYRRIGRIAGGRVPASVVVPQWGLRRTRVRLMEIDTYADEAGVIRGRIDPVSPYPILGVLIVAVPR